jgi:ribosomal-protein-serine acetyltransferase
VEFSVFDDVRLRLLEESDVDELHALIEDNRDHLARWLAWAETQTREDTQAFVRRTRSQFAADDGFQQAIVCDGRISGVVGLPGVEPLSRSTGIGYWLAEGCQGRGIMTTAVGALVDYAFGPLGLNRVEIRVATENGRSRAIPERLGFTQEAIFRRAERVSTRQLDMAVYSVLAAEWPGGEKRFKGEENVS